MEQESGPSLSKLYLNCKTCGTYMQINGEHILYCPKCFPDKTTMSLSFPSGAASSKIPRFDLIPYISLVELADRCELGLLRHKEKSWNAASKNQDVLLDEEFIIARAMHAVNHALKYVAKLRGQTPPDDDNDASAIMWAGMCLIAANERRRVKKGNANAT